MSDPFLEYHRVLMDRGRGLKELLPRQKDDLSFSGIKVHLAIYILLFLCTFSLSWHFVCQHVFTVQLILVLSSLIGCLALAVLNRQNPRNSRFFSPICVMLFAFSIGGVVQFFGHDIREACLYFIGIPVSVSVASCLISSNNFHYTQISKSFVAIVSVLSVGFLYLYVLLTEYLVHIPLDFPHQIDPSYIFILVLYVVGASYCVQKDCVIVNFSAMNGAKKNVESYLAFCQMATMFLFYIACAYFLLFDSD